MIARRTRLSFQNAEAALDALPKVIDMMAVELGWSKKRQNKEFTDATEFLLSMGLTAQRVAKLTLDDVRAGVRLPLPRGVVCFRFVAFSDVHDQL